MTDARNDAASNAVLSTHADAVTDPTMAPVDDAAGGPTADKEPTDAPDAEKAAAQLGDFA